MWARSCRYLARLLGESGVNSRSLIEEGSALRVWCCSGRLAASSSSAPQFHRCLSSLAAGPSEAEDTQKGAHLTFTSEEQPRRQPKELAMVFTCRQCNTRSMKLFSRRAFDHGVVIVTCPGCEVKHLIADRLGWFGDSGSVEDFLREKGEEVVIRKADGTLELSPEDIIGKSKAEALQQDAASS